MKNYRETLMWKEIGETKRMFSEIMPKNENVMKHLVAEVGRRGIRHIVGAGRGTSDHALIYFKYLTEIFSRMTVGLAGCSSLTMYHGKADFGDLLTVGVSQSGKAADAIEVLRRAKMQGGLTVAVTNDPESPMAKLAEFSLDCCGGEEKSVAATKTFSAQCFLLLWLAAELSENRTILERLPLLADEIGRDFSEIDRATDLLLPELAGMREGFVLGRGISYAVALESTLKLQETCYLLMKSYAESDFQHGPMAMVSAGTHVLFFAPRIGFAGEDAESSHTREFVEMMQKLSSFGGKIIAVTDNSDYDGVCSTCKIPSGGDEVFTFFRFALFAQMLACKLSCSKGNDPDSPRALKKVTITK